MENTKNKNLTQRELIYLATKAFEKGWDFEKLKYSDDLFHLEGMTLQLNTEDCWDYVSELQLYGIKAFKEKYNSKYENLKLFI